MTFTLPRPEDEGFINGALHLAWQCSLPGKAAVDLCTDPCVARPGVGPEPCR